MTKEEIKETLNHIDGERCEDIDTLFDKVIHSTPNLEYLIVCRYDEEDLLIKKVSQYYITVTEIYYDSYNDTYDQDEEEYNIYLDYDVYEKEARECDDIMSVETERDILNAIITGDHLK